MNRSQLQLLFVIFIVGCNGNKSRTTDSAPQVSKLRIEIIDPEALTVLDTSQRVQILAEGFKWTEGPLYLSDSNCLIFSDIPNNRICKWKEGQGVSTYLVPSGSTGVPAGLKEPGSNGLTLDATGHLVLCQHGDRRIAKMVSSVDNPKAEFVTLADNYEGKRLNSPNDAVYHPNGDLYFTDPPYGMYDENDKIKDSAKQLDFQGVYRLKPGGQVDLFTKDMKFPNGIALSPDSKYLYVASSDANNYIWMQYELDANGLAKNQRVFHEAHAYEGKKLGAPDGMKINKSGYIFASGPEGIWLFTPAGKLIAKVHTGQLTSNCAFSPGQSELYMTCDDYLMRLNLKKQ